MGLKAFYTDSEGNTVDNPRFLSFAEKKLKRLHRRVSKKQKKSANRKKARQRLAKAYLKVQRQREDFARKRANTLITSHDLIAYEDLQIRNMVRNHQLAKSISDAAWGRFLSWVNYYGAQHDIPVIAVAPQFTTQDCSGCGKRVYKALSVRTHVCPHCGLVLDRDQNAAKNILSKAIEGTVGHTGTSARTAVQVGNAWGQGTATVVTAVPWQQVAWTNQEPPVLEPGECQRLNLRRPQL
jgi:putative transposase